MLAKGVVVQLGLHVGTCRKSSSQGQEGLPTTQRGPPTRETLAVSPAGRDVRPPFVPDPVPGRRQLQGVWELSSPPGTMALQELRGFDGEAAPPQSVHLIRKCILGQVKAGHHVPKLPRARWEQTSHLLISTWRKGRALSLGHKSLKEERSVMGQQGPCSERTTVWKGRPKRSERIIGSDSTRASRKILSGHTEGSHQVRGRAQVMSDVQEDRGQSPGAGTCTGDVWCQGTQRAATRCGDVHR